MYSLKTNEYEKLLTRSTLPIRDIALSPDGKWAAVASDELTVKVINTEDMMDVMYIRDCPKPPKHLTFDPSGSYLSISCTNGLVYVYSVSTKDPELVNTFDGLILALEADSEASSRAAWHPDGRAFAIPAATRDVQVVSREGDKQRAFTGGHGADITALSWSPNGALLATTGADKRLLLWDTKTQTALAKYEYSNIINFVWHPTANAASFATSDGEIFIYNDFVPTQHIPLLQASLTPSPFIHDPLSETTGNARKLTNGLKPTAPLRPRHGTPDSLDDILNSDVEADGPDNFVIDDDGAGYALNGNGKRPSNPSALLPYAKRPAFFQPHVHPVLQPGSTPWRGNRRYLTLNLVGFIWAVDQDTHHTVTVEFYDREFHRDFHFTDAFRYDKACLTTQGALFSCPPGPSGPAQIYYRPHESWTARADWRLELARDEEVTSLALSEGYIVATTSAGYERVWTLFGVPVRVAAVGLSPVVSCAAWRDYILTLGNGPVRADGACQLLCSIENVKRDSVCQAQFPVSVSPGAGVQSVLFSDKGDPCVYDDRGVLFVLQHWRHMAQARWVPLLDTRRLERLASGRKAETYWPVAVAEGRFHCIILKGGDRYPYFPRPLLSEFDFEVPVSAVPLMRDVDEMDEDDNEGARDREVRESARLDELYVRSSLLHSLFEDALGSTRATRTQEVELGRMEVEVDKSLLQLLNVECRDGDERGMKALEIAGLLRDRSGKMLEAAGKIAGRYGRNVLEGKITELADKKLAGEDDEDELE